MPDRPLGPKQLGALRDLALRYVGLVPNATDRSLIARGMLRQDGSEAYCIAPAGLRALADAIEAGKVEDGLTWFARQKAEADAARDAGEADGRSGSPRETRDD
jgi:hypothetical protein